MKFILAALALMFGATQAPAQQPQQPQQARPPAPRTYSEADLWERTNDRITFRLGAISLPTNAGPTRLNRIVEASHQGQGLDNALLYYSPDEQVFVTIYIYAPGFPDAGLTAFTTDHAIQVSSGPDLRILRSGLVAAGGVEGAAIRTDYAGARDQRLASSAAFTRVGRWILKLRVSGPEARRAEVEATMATLLSEVRFVGRVEPTADTRISAADCPRGADRAAQRMAMDGADAMDDAILSIFLEHNESEDGTEPAPPPTPRRGTDWCRSAGFTIPSLGGSTPILRATTSASGDDQRRSVLFALIADNGTLMEVAERRFRNRTRYVLIHHQIGQTMVLGAYDAVPTDAQIEDILTGRDREGGRARATIDYQASGDSSVNMLVPMSVPATPAPANRPST